MVFTLLDESEMHVFEGSKGHPRTNEFVGLMPIREAVRLQNDKIRDKKLTLIFRWFYGK